MLIGSARVSKTDGFQSLDLQRDALQGGRRRRRRSTSATTSPPAFAIDRPGLDSCRGSCGKGDVLVVWKLDRLGRNLAHLVNTVQDLPPRGVGSPGMRRRRRRSSTTGRRTP